MFRKLGFCSDESDNFRLQLRSVICVPKAILNCFKNLRRNNYEDFFVGRTVFIPVILFFHNSDERVSSKSNLRT